MPNSNTKLQTFSAHRITDTKMASTAKEVLSFFMKKTSNVVKHVPILGQIAETFQEVYTVYEETTTNKKDAKLAMERCTSLANIIVQCVDSNNSFNEQQLHGVKLLNNHTQEMLSLVKAYCLKNVASKVLSNDDFRSQYDKINRRIDEALQMVQLSVQAKMMEQNNQIFALLTSENEFSANNQKMLNDWISQFGTIHSKTIALKEMISDEGANGVVHRGIKDGHMEVAVKVVNIPHAKMFENLKNEAFRETFIGMTFQHPNIVRTLGCAYDQKPNAKSNGVIMIIMEFMKHGSLHQFIKQQHTKLTKADRHAFMFDAASGIYEMHLKRKCHHDVKPGNMLVSDRYHVKVCDLDSVKDLSATDSKTTKSTVGAHTKQYTAPEYLKGGTVYNFKCDVFSFAMSMYEVATGKTPFKGMTPDQVANALMSKDARPELPNNIHDLVDGKYIKLMRNAWKTDPTDRPSMKDVVSELQVICNLSGRSNLQVPRAPNSSAGSSNKKAEEEKKKLKEITERIRREKEEAIAKRDREHQAEIEQLKRQQEEQLKQLKQADAERARKLHEKELKEAKLREENKRKKTLRLNAMKQMPVIQRTNQLLTEKQQLSNISEAKSKWDQYEEIISNITSLKQKLFHAKNDMEKNIDSEKQQNERRKQRLKKELENANARYETAVDDANVQNIKLIRKEINSIQEKLNGVGNFNTRNFKAEVENLNQEIEVKESKINEFNALFDHEKKLHEQCEYLLHDIKNEIKTVAKLDNETFDDALLDELGNCQDTVKTCKTQLLERPVLIDMKHKEEKERKEKERERKEKERKEKKPANDYKSLFEKYNKEFPKGTPLVCACEKGRVEDVEGMIRGARAAGMDVTAMVSEVGKDSDGISDTPLMAAAWYEHSTIIEILLQYNADTATTNEYGKNALHYAARNNKTTTTTVQVVLNNMKLEDINHKNTSGNTPLDLCYKNTSSIKQQLIDLIRQKGGKRAYESRETYDWKTLSEIYKKEFPKGTPLVCACEKGRVEDVDGMIRGARAAGMDVTAMVSEVGTDSYDYSKTPLMAAAMYEHSTIIETLLQYNADTATTGQYGWNALHIAAEMNKTSTTTVQLLLDNMKLEDINHISRGGYTPLDRCYIWNTSSIKQQLIDLIRQKGGKRKSELPSGGCCIVS